MTTAGNRLALAIKVHEDARRFRQQVEQRLIVARQLESDARDDLARARDAAIEDERIEPVREAFGLVSNRG